MGQVVEDRLMRIANCVSWEIDRGKRHRDPESLILALESIEVYVSDVIDRVRREQVRDSVADKWQRGWLARKAEERDNH